MSDKKFIPLYLAPMEEITGYVFRNTIDKIYGGVDKYFTPFVTPNQNKILKTREGRELIPEHNEGLNVVPQILTNNAEHFLEMYEETLSSLGYKEINFNFGCPSNTVVKKNKGSGIFRDLYLLDDFLRETFDGLKDADVKVSVKTRIGIFDDEDFPDILNIYNKYPISELIIHPRVQKEFYSGKPHMETFDYAYHNAKMPVCYNGDIKTVQDYIDITNKYPDLSGVMIGRGAVANPEVFSNIKNYLEDATKAEESINNILEYDSIDKKKLREFCNNLLSIYESDYSVIDGISKMKEVWSYLYTAFPGCDKSIKNLRKAKSKAEYLGAVNEIFSL